MKKVLSILFCCLLLTQGVATDAYGNDYGYEDGYDFGYKDGYDFGCEDGYDYGYKDGYDEARNELRSVIEDMLLSWLLPEDFETEANNQYKSQIAEMYKTMFYEMLEAVAEYDGCSLEDELTDLTPSVSDDSRPLQSSGYEDYLSRVEEYNTPELNGTNGASWEMQETDRSTCFSSVGYDAKNEELHVVFRNSGKEYIYSDFPNDDWEAFWNAESLGKYYNAHIKGQYPSRKG